MNIEHQYKQDFEYVLTLIQDARDRAYNKANSELVMLYFSVGKIVSEKVDAGTWGEKTVQQLADFIQSKAPNLSGFNRRGLYRMKQFYESYTPKSAVFTLWVETVSPITTQTVNEDAKVSTALTPSHTPDKLYEKFVSTVLTQIQWSSHLHILSKTKTAEESLFYLLQTITQKLSVRELERQLNTAAFERTMLSNKLIASTTSGLPKDLFRDPYMFEFLDLPDGHTEKDLEKAITLNLQRFILEVGKGFTYMGNQYRLQVGNKDYYTDLLFYHRDLQCLVLFELKIEDFAPEFLGKLNFYLEALDRDVKRPHEKASIGVLLCKGKDNEVVEYAMARNTSPSVIADYETKLIDKKVLAKKLHQLAQLLDKPEEK